MQSEAMSDIHEFRNMLAKELKALRVNAGLTQVNAAEKLRVSVGHIGSLENGHSMPSIELLRTYESVFGIDPYCATHDLLRWERDRKRQAEAVRQRLKKQQENEPFNVLDRSADSQATRKS